MGLSTNQVTVTTTATLILAGDPDGCHIVIKNIGGRKMYLGNADVTADTGHELGYEGVHTIAFGLGPDEALYGITASGTCTVSYLATMNQ